MADNLQTTFTDNKGDSWTVLVTYGHRLEVKKQTQIDLWELFDDELQKLAQFVNNYPKIVEVAACLLSDELDRRGITAEEFGYRMGGDSLEGAAEAIVQATIDFFPEASRREAIRGAWTRLKQVQSMMLAEVPRAAFDQWDQRDWSTELKEWSGRLLASQDSTPTAARSGN